MTDSNTNPDFEKRYKFLQPGFQRSRAAYRSPLDSEGYNLHQGLSLMDILALYNQFGNIDNILEARVNELYEGFDDLQVELESIEGYAAELGSLRQEILQYKNIYF